MRKQIHSGDKTRLAYWRRRVFQPAYVRDGVKMISPNYAVEMQHKGKRVRWSLGPANIDAAASRARDLYLFLIANGWEATLAKYRPAKVAKADPTIGDFLEAVRKTADLSPQTLKDYVGFLQ